MNKTCKHEKVIAECDNCGTRLLYTPLEKVNELQSTITKQTEIINSLIFAGNDMREQASYGLYLPEKWDIAVDEATKKLNEFN